MNPSDLIYCNDCQKSLPVEQFARRAASKNSFQPRCLSCASRRIKKWKSKKKHEELIKAGQLMLNFKE